MTKREPREVRDEQTTVTRQHVPRRMSGKTTPQGHAVAVTTQEALDGSREKTMRVANIENNSLNWVSISSAGALDMTNCDFSERRARDEMRHIIGSSEPDVNIGSDNVEGLYPTPHIHEQMTAQIMATSTTTLSTTR